MKTAKNTGEACWVRGMMLLLCLILWGQGALFAETKVIILGDSLTEGYGVEKTEAYPYLVQKQLDAQGYKVNIINAGVSGSTSASALSRLRWFLKVKPDILILALGGNDGLRGLNAAQMKQNLAQTIELALTKKMLILLAGMQIPPNYGPEYVQAFKQVYPELAQHYKIHLIPFLLEGVGGIPELNQPDGIHPNAKGHQIMASLIVNNLIPLLSKTQ
ncbi:arylesterase [Deltaproteobacteria bacterium TL4]